MKTGYDESGESERNGKVKDWILGLGDRKIGKKYSSIGTLSMPPILPKIREFGPKWAIERWGFLRTTLWAQINILPLLILIEEAKATTSFANYRYLVCAVRPSCLGWPKPKTSHSPDIVTGKSIFWPTRMGWILAKLLFGDSKNR